MISDCWHSFVFCFCFSSITNVTTDKMAGNLSLVQDVQKRWRAEFNAVPPSRLTITKLFATIAICEGWNYVWREGAVWREEISIERERDWCSGTEFRKIPKEAHMASFSWVRCKQVKYPPHFTPENWKFYIPRLLHALNEDDPDRRDSAKVLVIISEILLHYWSNFCVVLVYTLPYIQKAMKIVIFKQYDNVTYNRSRSGYTPVLCSFASSKCL